MQQEVCDCIAKLDAVMLCVRAGPRRIGKQIPTNGHADELFSRRNITGHPAQRHYKSWCGLRGLHQITAFGSCNPNGNWFVIAWWYFFIVWHKWISHELQSLLRCWNLWGAKHGPFEVCPPGLKKVRCRADRVISATELSLITARSYQFSQSCPCADDALLFLFSRIQVVTLGDVLWVP